MSDEKDSALSYLAGRLYGSGALVASGGLGVVGGDPIAYAAGADAARREREEERRRKEAREEAAAQRRQASSTPQYDPSNPWASMPSLAEQRAIDEQVSRRYEAETKPFWVTLDDVRNTDVNDRFNVAKERLLAIAQKCSHTGTLKKPMIKAYGEDISDICLFWMQTQFLGLRLVDFQPTKEMIQVMDRLDKPPQAGPMDSTRLIALDRTTEGPDFGFFEETIVKTENGPKKVKDVQYGDKLLSWDDWSKEQTYSRVLGIKKSWKLSGIDTYVILPEGKDKPLEANQGQLFWLKPVEGRSYVRSAKELRRGNVILVRNDKGVPAWTPIASITGKSNGGTFYAFRTKYNANVCAQDIFAYPVHVPYSGALRAIKRGLTRMANG